MGSDLADLLVVKNSNALPAVFNKSLMNSILQHQHCSDDCPCPWKVVLQTSVYLRQQIDQFKTTCVVRVRNKGTFKKGLKFLELQGILILQLRELHE